MNYKVIFLDWNGVLSVSRFWQQWEDPDHHKFSISPKIKETLFTNLYTLIHPWMRGEYTSEEIVQAFSKHLQLPFEEVWADFVVSCQQMQFTSPEISKLIKKLQRKGLKVFIATDNMDSFTRWTVPSMDLEKLFDGILCSSDLGFLKDDLDDQGNSLFFKEIIRKEKLQKGESVLLDDREITAGSVKGLGIDFIPMEYGKGLAEKLQSFI